MPAMAPLPGSAANIPVHSYRDLVVWQRSMELSIQCYGLARSLPADERYGLISQMCRAAVSIPANIAEGHGRLSRAEYTRHLTVARGSLKELDTLLLITQRLDLLPGERIQSALDLADQVSRMLTMLIRKLGTRTMKR
jgi:four helix bundle protein